MRIHIIIFIFLPLVTIAQKQDNNWYFGDSLIMTFSDTGIVTMQAQGKCHETSVSISDSVGNLLFYSDGYYVWNKNHVIMSNSYLDIYAYVSLKINFFVSSKGTLQFKQY